MQEIYSEISLLTDALTDGEFSALEDEMELEFSSGTLKVLHTPGHTPGSCSFLREANRTSDRRRLRFETNHAESDCFARSG